MIGIFFTFLFSRYYAGCLSLLLFVSNPYNNPSKYQQYDYGFRYGTQPESFNILIILIALVGPGLEPSST